MKNQIQEFKVRGDHRGKLIALEENRDIPFNIKRVFYIYSTQEDAPRGEHAHYKTKQFLIAVNGSCKVTLDDGEKKTTFNLNKPNLGLVQDAMIWGTMHDFSSDCILMVLADSYYEEQDYIRKYSTFLEMINHAH